MIKIVLVVLMAFLLAGCGDSTTKVSELKVTEVNISDDEIIIVKIDINDSETFFIENNITIIASEAGLYGDGTFKRPLKLVQANFLLEAGDTWLKTPEQSINHNCTVQTRLRVKVSDIWIEDASLNEVAMTSIARNRFDFDINSTYIRMKISCLEAGYISFSSKCLEHPDSMYNY